MSDPIADLLTRIRNSSGAQKRYVDIPFSKIKLEIVKVIKETGFISEFKEIELNSKKTLRVFLKYTKDRQPVIKQLKRESKPGLRKYVAKEQIPTVLGGMGISVLSTSQGVLEGNEAKKRNLGGELLCVAW